MKFINWLRLILSMALFFCCTSTIAFGTAKSAFTPETLCESSDPAIQFTIELIQEQMGAQTCREVFQRASEVNRLVLKDDSEEWYCEEIRAIDLTPLTFFSNLRELEIGSRMYCTRVADFSPLTELPQIETLRVYPTQESEANWVVPENVQTLYVNAYYISLQALNNLVGSAAGLMSLEVDSLALTEEELSAFTTMLPSRLTGLHLRYTEVLLADDTPREPIGFNAPELAQLAAHLPDLSELTIDTSVPSMEPFSAFSKLVSLDISPDWNMESFSLEGVQKIDHLRVLRIFQMLKCTNAHLLANNTALVELDIDGSNVASLDFLMHLTRLESLQLRNLGDNHNQLDLSPLSKLRRLRKLTLESLKNAFNYGALLSLRHMTEIDLQSSHIDDFIFLAGMPMLTRVSLGWTNLTDKDLLYLATAKQVENMAINNTNIDGSGLRYIAALRKLTYLDLDECKIDDAGLTNFAFWSSRSKLEHLRLYKNTGKPLTGATIHVLHKFKHLKILMFSFNQLDNSGLANLARELPWLTYIDLRGGLFDDAGLQSLSALSDLEKLSLSFNTNLTDAGLVTFHGLKKLQYLNLGATSINPEDEGLLQLQLALPNLVVDFYAR